MATDPFSLLASELGEIRIKRNIDISDQLQSRLGGTVGAFYIATTDRELVRVVELARELRLKFMVLGLGSKTSFPLVTTRGKETLPLITTRGKTALAKDNPDLLVIKNRSDNLKIFGIKGKVSREGLGIEEAFIEAGSGSSLQNLAEYTSRQKLTGLEDLKGGIGTVGGNFFINPTIREKATAVKILDPRGDIKEVKEVRDVSKDDIILAVVFKLRARKDGGDAV